PAAYVLRDALPLTENGKVARQALLALATSQREEEAAYTPPRNEVEGELAQVFAEVLGLDRVGIDDRFFSLGGDSIRSLRVRTLAEERGLRFSLQELLEHQTVRELARHAEPAAEPGATSPPPFGLLAPRDPPVPARGPRRRLSLTRPPARHAIPQRLPRGFGALPQREQPPALGAVRRRSAPRRRRVAPRPPPDPPPLVRPQPLQRAPPARPPP